MKQQEPLLKRQSCLIPSLQKLVQLELQKRQTQIRLIQKFRTERMLIQLLITQSTKR
nr:MAG TPA: hypothetical protein [Bacteriophage sp.]